MDRDLPDEVDALVVGGGPAGLSAATWLGRYQRSTLVVDAGQHRNRHADQSHGLLGRDPTTPGALLTEALAGLGQYPLVQLHPGTVDTVDHAEGGGFVAVVDGVEVIARRIVLATGVRDRFPQIAGFQDHYGTDVHHCPACDGYTASGQDVVVLGGGDRVPAYAAELLDWAATVRIVTDTTDQAFDQQQRTELTDHGIEVVEGPAATLIGDPGALEGVRLADGRLVQASSVFFSYAHLPTNALAVRLGCELDDEGRVLVNGYQLTSMDGIYAAGDLTPGLQLVSIAIGQGTAAGVACATSLRGHGTARHAPPPAPPTHRFTHP